MNKAGNRCTGTQVLSAGEDTDARQRMLSTLLALQDQASVLYGRIECDALALNQLHRRMLITLAVLCNLPVIVPERVPPPRSETSAAFLRLSEVVLRVGLSRSATWRMAKEGQFPRPRRLSTRRVGWTQTR
jgi:predicted DNA-binding transcriptional regulator AlpA